MVDFHKATERLRQNIAERKQREADEASGLALYRMAGELLGPELVKLSEHGKLTFWQAMRDLAESRLPKPEEKKLAEPPAGMRHSRRFRPIANSPDFEHAIAIVEQICELADSDDIPDAGIEFAEDVSVLARDIGETIEEKQHATPGQINALENMHAALSRWID